MKLLKIILLGPFSLVFGIITSIRNYLFDKNILKSYEPNIFSVGIGNITVGGTGKTPMALHISRYFENRNLAFLSRGYGRKSQGFYEIKNNTPINLSGDEPKLLKLKSSKNSKVYVGENRVEAFKKIINNESATEILLLDDVYQHRKIKPSFLIVLINYNQLIYNDFLMPLGKLRESPKGLNRANYIIVTKCPKALNNSEKLLIEDNLRKYSKKTIPITFSSIVYEKSKNWQNQELNNTHKIVLISAIANNNEFYEYASNEFEIIKHYSFSDHHHFSKTEIGAIIEKHKNLNILCTEKDYVKIIELIDDYRKKHFYYLPISIEIDEEQALKRWILTSFNDFIQNQQSN